MKLLLVSFRLKFPKDNPSLPTPSPSIRVMIGHNSNPEVHTMLFVFEIVFAHLIPTERGQPQKLKHESYVACVDDLIISFYRPCRALPGLAFSTTAPLAPYSTQRTELIPPCLKATDHRPPGQAHCDLPNLNPSIGAPFLWGRIRC
jgi:hypothetical protein